MQSVYQMQDQLIKWLCRRAELIRYSKSFKSANQFASSMRTAGQHLALCPTSLLDEPIFRLTSFRLRPLCTQSECSKRDCCTELQGCRFRNN